MAFQFLHIDTVARVVPKKATSKRWSLSEVLAEANRNKEACPHIENPQPPKCLYGVPLRTVGEAVLRRADEARDASGRKLRRDAPVLLAGVVSYPVGMRNMNEQDRVDYEQWEKRTLNWLRNRFGDGLASVVRHSDETFPHLHFFAVPEVTAAHTLDIEGLHPGIAARETAKRAGKTGKEANRAYCGAMRDLQNDFHDSVGIFHGHLRLGPARRRLSRGAYLSERQEAKRRANLMGQVEGELVELERLRVESVLNSRARERADLLEIENAKLRDNNQKLASGLKEVVDDRDFVKARRRFLEEATSHSASVMKAFVLFVLTGHAQCRAFLLTADRPYKFDAEAWRRLLDFLRGSYGDTGAKRVTSRRDDDSGRERTPTMKRNEEETR
jgi:hypothetical protein